ncbi:isocitrate/isopropylmalate dehydrogenase family protein [Salinisphaera sp.]|uniref:isocitrate/isopropylmalate dehydrogenase family protein n=1 Tax=Salinisphaera sp. TaxID=1914330 RepID=UPI002D78A47C|nr:isocitrate/isopropylmalate family dehydrogenase [Salinisphaera sp.]HET7313278.1 isocitrate/isopropylmalate family dehydrogenase [Salinisphaera sp.]
MTAKKTWRVAILPGDGIGPEVIAQATRALDTLAGIEPELAIDYDTFDWPSHAWHEAHGESAPADYLERLAGYDAILLGALGDPGPVSDPDRYLLSDSDSLAPLLEIRKGFDQWVCERPVRRLEGAPQYLADPRANDIDMLVIRENSEGEYVNQGGRLAAGTPNEVVTQTAVFTHRATDRIIRHAFEQARARAGLRQSEGRERQFGPDKHTSQVCLVTKRNAQKFWGDMYTEMFAEVANDYPDVATQHELVDAACMKFVSHPWLFDVVVASNLHGDILTDLAAVLNGGMGVSPSANLNPSDRSRPPMFEPTHGSAPDIAGQNKAGPAAMLLTAAMMLDWMGEEDTAAARAGMRLREAVAADLAAHTGASRTTDAVGDAVVAGLQAGRI